MKLFRAVSTCDLFYLVNVLVINRWFNIDDESEFWCQFYRAGFSWTNIVSIIPRVPTVDWMVNGRFGGWCWWRQDILCLSVYAQYRS